jgi:hypothetical protein
MVPEALPMPNLEITRSLVNRRKFTEHKDGDDNCEQHHKHDYEDFIGNLVESRIVPVHYTVSRMCISTG